MELAQQEAERASNELNAKSEQFSKDRRAMRADLSRLQAEHDALVQSSSATEGRLQALQSTHAMASQQLVRAQTTVQDLRSRLAEREATYAGEVANLKRLVELMEDRESQAKSIVESIEEEWATVGERAERREAALREEVDKAKRRTEAAERRVEDMERVLERVNRGEFPVPVPGSTPGTPMRNGTPDLMTQGMFGLSPAVAMASRVQKSGKTFTEVYADHVRLQEDHAHKCAEHDRMDRTLAEVLAQIEERVRITILCAGG
jgi:nucleoprotein TPR